MTFRKMCEVNRKFLPGPLTGAPFRVDDFTRGVDIYFLTHAHMDHMTGLTESWRHGNIYCTDITKRLVLARFPCFDASLISVLEIGESKLIRVDDSRTLSVTVLDANHCAGSCMYLFESRDFGRMLHTGDFRFEFAEQIPEVLRETQEGMDTCVYVDNTYGLKRSPSFPSRNEVKTQLLKVVSKFPKHVRFVFSMHGLGKEELVAEVALTLKTRVLVTDRTRLEQIWACGNREWLDLFTDGEQDELSKRFDGDEHEAFRVIVVTQSGLSEEEVPENESADLPVKTGHLVLTQLDDASQTTDPCKLGQKNVFALREGDVTVTCSGWSGMEAWEVLCKLAQVAEPFGAENYPKQIRVPYSLHSTRAEIQQFLSSCVFQNVIPIVHVTERHRNELLSIVDHVTVPMNPRVMVTEINLEGATMTKRTTADRPIQGRVNRIIASPSSHARRMELHRTRLCRGQSLLMEDEIQILVKRDLRQGDWTVAEDALLAEIVRKRKLGDCEAHAAARRKLMRSDHEIMLRLSWVQRNLKEDEPRIPLT